MLTPIALFTSILASAAPQRSGVCHWHTLLLPPSDPHGHTSWQPTHVVSLTWQSRTAVPVRQWPELEHAIARAAAINPSAVAVIGGGTGGKLSGAAGATAPQNAVLRMRIAAPCATVASRLLRRCTGTAGAALQRAAARLSRGGYDHVPHLVQRGALAPRVLSLSSVDQGQLREGGDGHGSLLAFPAVVDASGQRAWADERASNVLLGGGDDIGGGGGSSSSGGGGNSGTGAREWWAPATAAPIPARWTPPVSTVAGTGRATMTSSGAAAADKQRRDALAAQLHGGSEGQGVAGGVKGGVDAWIVFDFARPVAVGAVEVGLPGNAANPRVIDVQAGAAPTLGDTAPAAGVVFGPGAAAGTAAPAALHMRVAAAHSHVALASSCRTHTALLRDALSGGPGVQCVAATANSRLRSPSSPPTSGEMPRSLQRARFWRLIVRGNWGTNWGVALRHVTFGCVDNAGVLSAGECRSLDRDDGGLAAVFSHLSGRSFAAAIAGASVCAFACVCAWLVALRRELTKSQTEMEEEILELQAMPKATFAGLSRTASMDSIEGDGSFGGFAYPSEYQCVTGSEAATSPPPL